MFFHSTGIKWFCFLKNLFSLFFEEETIDLGFRFVYNAQISTSLFVNLVSDSSKRLAILVTERQTLERMVFILKFNMVMHGNT